MRILYVDDEQGMVSDYRRTLREIGHVVKPARKIMDAVDLLNKSFTGASAEHPPYDLVLIDLLLTAQDISPALKKYFPIQNHNEGQSLGQWLWDEAGARRIRNRPIHCYFTSVPALYNEHSDTSKQEFINFEIAKNKFVLNKTKVRPYQLNKRLSDVCDDWIPFKII